jgi:hypothetical protein
MTLDERNSLEGVRDHADLEVIAGPGVVPDLGDRTRDMGFDAGANLGLRHVAER